VTQPHDHIISQDLITSLKKQKSGQPCIIFSRYPDERKLHPSYLALKSFDKAVLSPNSSNHFELIRKRIRHIIM
jgi:hypothetical protein